MRFRILSTSGIRVWGFWYVRDFNTWVEWRQAVAANLRKTRNNSKYFKTDLRVQLDWLSMSQCICLISIRPRSNYWAIVITYKTNNRTPSARTRANEKCNFWEKLKLISWRSFKLQFVQKKSRKLQVGALITTLLVLKKHT